VVYVYDYSALAFSHKLSPPLSLVEKEVVPESEQEEADELESVTCRIITGGEALSVRIA
jgi:hypothetical protein